MDHSYNASVAKDFGIKVAVFLNNIAFWVKKNLQNNKNHKQGHYWTFNSVKDFCEVFGCFTIKQMRNIIDKADDNGLLLINNFNRTKYDRTRWFTLSEKALQYYPELKQLLVDSNLVDRRANGDDQRGPPIPDINKDKNIHEGCAFVDNFKSSKKPGNVAPSPVHKSKIRRDPEKAKLRKGLLSALTDEKRKLYEIFTKDLGINIDIALKYVIKLDVQHLNIVYEASKDDSIFSKGGWVNYQLDKIMKYKEKYPNKPIDTLQYNGAKMAQKGENITWTDTQPSEEAKIKNQAILDKMKSIGENNKKPRSQRIAINSALDMCYGVLGMRRS